MAPPRVSVIIPAYNQARFLPLAVGSVLAQTYRDFEVIIVDDGSTDETPLVAQEFGDQVLYVRQENRGLAGARNTGIEHARGELIALLDSDDEWLPAYLEKMVALADAHPEAVVCYCPVVYIDIDGRALPQKTPARVPPSDELYAVLLRKNFLVPSTILMRRAAVVEAGLFASGFRRLEDWELWLRLLGGGATFAGSADRLVRYRLHGSSLSADPLEMQKAAQDMAERLFGPDDRDWPHWGWEKRRCYGGVYRYQALSSIQYWNDWDTGARLLEKALRVDPSLSQDFDMFYELALGPQPLGYRGTRQQASDISSSAARLLAALETLFRSSRADGDLRREVFATAYQALGIVAYNKEEYALSRRYLLAALRQRPALLGKAGVASALVKSFLGASILRWLRRRRGAQAQSVPASPGEPDISG